MSDLNFTKLSNMISVDLHHHPEAFDLELDSEGWVAVDDLLAALRSRRREWAQLCQDDLIAMMQAAGKQRYEIKEGRIRALYGHSVVDKIEKVAAEPPEMLYHGTDPAAAQIILSEGLKPMARQYVHHSTDVTTARMVGSRKSANPVILKVRALDAHRAGMLFYLGNEDIWLSDAVPPQFIEKAE